MSIFKKTTLPSIYSRYNNAFDSLDSAIGHFIVIIEDLERKARVEESKKEIEINELKHEHQLELKDKEQEIKTFESDKVKELEEKMIKADAEISVLKKENEMLTKIADINGDIIDIKDLVQGLIKKLPEINLQNLTINSESNKK